MIKAVIDNLLPHERKQLMYAFENQMAQFVKLPKGKFIGVNTGTIKHLSPTEQVGVWTYGDIQGVDDAGD